jgi:hypothetical protein
VPGSGVGKLCLRFMLGDELEEILIELTNPLVCDIFVDGP